MLRVLKQKALEASADDTQSKGLLPTSMTVEVAASTTRREQIPIVSHVPISIGTPRIGSSSAESTISSRSDEDESCRETSISNKIPKAGMLDLERQEKSRDSPTESSHEVCTSKFTTLQKSALDQVLLPCGSPKVLARSRCISIEDQDSCLPFPCKRPRLLSKGSDASIQSRTKVLRAPMTLLAREEDESVLSPLHSFIRKQIEVFTATSVELRQPAPGRKQPIKLHQVGLRCIHCKNNSSGRRVKRAVCYPTNVGRIYHSVSDMKFDHFSSCMDLPDDIRAEFESLKAEGNKRNNDSKHSRKGSVSSTAQYYHDSAIKMGMCDGPQGIFISGHFPWNVRVDSIPTPAQKARDCDPHFYIFPRTFPIAILNSPLMRGVHPISTSPGRIQNGAIIENSTGEHYSSGPIHHAPTRFESRLTLDEDSDSQNLNEIHCFVRKHIEFFAASKNDISAPAPGRKTRVVLGQVGIRCIHCLSLPPRHRVKRAICYPPSVGGIYHAVSNMKFDHFANCRGLPIQARQEFRTLKEICCRKGSGGNSSTGSKGTTSSTKKYYEDSAIRKGLMDSETGIRLASSEKVEKDINSSPRPVAIPCGLSALVKAACQAA